MQPLRDTEKERMSDDITPDQKVRGSNPFKRTAVIPVIPVTFNDTYDTYDANLEVIQQTNQNLSQVNQ